MNDPKIMHRSGNGPWLNCFNLALIYLDPLGRDCVYQKDHLKRQKGTLLRFLYSCPCSRTIIPCLRCLECSSSVLLNTNMSSKYTTTNFLRNGLNTSFISLMNVLGAFEKLNWDDFPLVEPNLGLKYGLLLIPLPNPNLLVPTPYVYLKKELSPVEFIEHVFTSLYEMSIFSGDLVYDSAINIHPHRTILLSPKKSGHSTCTQTLTHNPLDMSSSTFLWISKVSSGFII